MVEMKLFHTDTLNLGNQEIMLFPFFFYKQLGFHTIVPIRRKHHRFAKLIMTCRCTHYYLGGLQILPCFWVDGKWMVSVKNQWMTFNDSGWQVFDDNRWRFLFQNRWWV